MGTEASISETIIWRCKMAKVLEPHIKQQTNIHGYGQGEELRMGGL